MASGTTVGIVIPTLRRPATIHRLLASIADQDHPVDAIVLVDQSGSPTGPGEYDEHNLPCTIDIIRRPPGVSAARNAGVAHLTGIDIVGTPDDDVWYSPGSVAAAVDTISGGCHSVSGKMTDERGLSSRWTFPTELQEITRNTVWRCAIEFTMFYQRTMYTNLGGMNEGIGLGSGNPWKSGEVTDLLIRALDQGYTLTYDPRIRVAEHSEEYAASQSLHRTRSYARGTGRVAAWHRQPTEITKMVGGPIVRSLASTLCGNWSEAQRHAVVALGRTEGLLGITLATPKMPDSTC